MMAGLVTRAGRRLRTREGRSLARAWLTEDFNSQWKHGRRPAAVVRPLVYAGGFVWAAWRLRLLVATGAVPGLDGHTVTVALAAQLYLQAFFAAVVRTRRDLYVPARAENALVTPDGGRALLTGHLFYAAAKALSSAFWLAGLLLAAVRVSPVWVSGAFLGFALAGFLGRNLGALATLVLVRLLARAASGMHFLMAILQAGLLAAFGWLLQQGRLNLFALPASLQAMLFWSALGGVLATAALLAGGGWLTHAVYEPGYQGINQSTQLRRYRPRWLTPPGRGFAAAFRAMANREILLQSRSPIFVARILFFVVALAASGRWAAGAAGVNPRAVATLLPAIAYLISFGELNAASFQGEGGRIALLVTSPQPFARFLIARAAVQAGFAFLVTAAASVAMSMLRRLDIWQAVLAGLVSSGAAALMSASLLFWGVLAVNPDYIPSTQEEDMLAEQAIASLPALVGIVAALVQLASLALALSPRAQRLLGETGAGTAYLLPVVANVLLPITAWALAVVHSRRRFRRAA